MTIKPTIDEQTKNLPTKYFKRKKLPMQLLSVFPLKEGWASGKRINNGLDEGILNSISANKWCQMKNNTPFDQGSLWI